MPNPTEVNIDLANYRDEFGQNVPPARYRVKVEDAQVRRANTGNEQIWLWLRVLNGPQEGATLVDRLTITERALFRVVAFLTAVGLPTPQKKFKLPMALIKGRVLEVDVQDGEPYMGRVRSEVKGYLRVTGTQPATAETDVPDDLSGLEEFAAPETNGAAAEPVSAPADAAAPADALGTIEETSDDSVDSDELVDLDALDLG